MPLASSLALQKSFYPTYQQFAQLDLLPQVAQVIKKYQRWTI